MFTGFQGKRSLLEIVGTFFPATELKSCSYYILYIMESNKKEESKGRKYVVDGKEWIVGEQKSACGRRQNVIRIKKRKMCIKMKTMKQQVPLKAWDHNGTASSLKKLN